MVSSTVFRSSAEDSTAVSVSVSDGGSLTVGESQLVGVDGSSDPFPCVGTLLDCVGVHQGLVEVEGPVAITLASPLVCDIGTGVCLVDLCVLMDYCNRQGACASSEGVCTCNAGYTGASCEVPPVRHVIILSRIGACHSIFVFDLLFENFQFTM